MENQSNRKFAIIITTDQHRTSVLLNEEPKLFGRLAIYVDVCLKHETIPKKLFEIRWNTQHRRHEIQVLGAYYPPAVNGITLESAECRLLSPGDIIAIGPFKMEYAEVEPGYVDPDIPAGSIEISRQLADRAQSLISGCEQCNTQASVPFTSVLDRITKGRSGDVIYFLRIPLSCERCGRPMTENAGHHTAVSG